MPKKDKSKEAKEANAEADKLLSKLQNELLQAKTEITTLKKKNK